MSLRTLSPVDQSVIIERPETTAAQLDEIFAQSVTAFRSYAKTTTLQERISVASKFLDLLTENMDALSKEITLQMGRPLRYTPIEIKTAVMRGRYMLKIAQDSLKDIAGDQSDPKINRFLKKVPVGPCYIIGA